MGLKFTTPVKHGSRQFEIRVYENEGDYFVAGYEKGEQKTAGYTVKMEVGFDFHAYHGSWAHDHLVAAVTDDINNGRIAPGE
jgi:hypothetical protein